jgi:hypothetical protein
VDACPAWCREQGARARSSGAIFHRCSSSKPPRVLKNGKQDDSRSQASTVNRVDPIRRDSDFCNRPGLAGKQARGDFCWPTQAMASSAVISSRQRRFTARPAFGVEVAAVRVNWNKRPWTGTRVYATRASVAARAASQLQYRRNRGGRLSQLGPSRRPGPARRGNLNLVRRDVGGVVQLEDGRERGALVVPAARPVVFCSKTERASSRKWRSSAIGGSAVRCSRADGPGNLCTGRVVLPPR